MTDLGKRFIAVSGNIGAGKSTLVTRLASAVGSTAVLENHAANHFLESFYADPSRWAFHVQAGFLRLSLLDYGTVAGLGGGAVLERTLEEHHAVFARQLLDSEVLTEPEFETLEGLHGLAQSRVEVAPDLLVFLEASPEELARRIAERDRAGESKVTLDYLSGLNARYASFVSGWALSPVVRVDTEAIDVRTDDGLQAIVRLSESALRDGPK